MRESSNGLVFFCDAKAELEIGTGPPGAVKKFQQFVLM